jgi:hypothetical protein
METLDVGDLVIQVSYMGDADETINVYSNDIGIVIGYDKEIAPYEYYRVQWLSDGVVFTYCRDDLLKVRNDYQFRDR